MGWGEIRSLMLTPSYVPLGDAAGLRLLICQMETMMLNSELVVRMECVPGSQAGRMASVQVAVPPR